MEKSNAQGGLLGRPVEMVVADGKSDPAVFAAEAERLITQEKSAPVRLLDIGLPQGGQAGVEKHQHLMFYPVQYEGLEQSPNISTPVRRRTSKSFPAPAGPCTSSASAFTWWARITFSAYCQSHHS